MEPCSRQEWVTDGAEEEILKAILDAMRSIRYGSVQIVLHDGKVVQVETVEKVRFPRTPTVS